MHNIKTVRLFLKSIRQAKILSDFQPDIVIGTGGYVSGAVVYAAAKMGIPTVIHEQTVYQVLPINFKPICGSDRSFI